MTKINMSSLDSFLSHPDLQSSFYYIRIKDYIKFTRVTVTNEISIVKLVKILLYYSEISIDTIAL